MASTRWLSDWKHSFPLTREFYHVPPAGHGTLPPAWSAPAHSGQQRVKRTRLACDARLWCCVHLGACDQSSRCGHLGCQPLAWRRRLDLRSHPRCLAALWRAVDRPADDQRVDPGCRTQPHSACADPQLSDPTWRRTEHGAHGCVGNKNLLFLASRGSRLIPCGRKRHLEKSLVCARIQMSLPLHTVVPPVCCVNETKSPSSPSPCWSVRMDGPPIPRVSGERFARRRRRRWDGARAFADLARPAHWHGD